MFAFFTYSLLLLHTFVGLILIGVILLQRGRGGGLAGAFGGMGGQSFLGTKAGDVFTRITIYLSTSWIILGCICVLMASSPMARTGKFEEGSKAGLKSADDGAGLGLPEGAAGEGTDKKDGDGVPPAPAKSEADAKSEDKADAKTDGAKVESKDAKATTPAEEPEPAKDGDAKPDAAKPDAAKPDAAKPEAAKPDAAKDKETPAAKDATGTNKPE